MLLNGPRTYTLVKVETDTGVYGVAEAYGSPGLGIVDAIHGVKEFLIGRDPLEIDRLYTGYRYTDGSAHHQQRAMSGIEMALWDLAGKLLNVPSSTLLGGRFREKVRLYVTLIRLNFWIKKPAAIGPTKSWRIPTASTATSLDLSAQVLKKTLARIHRTGSFQARSCEI
jgi:L-alanine-DL-glutamate epimerase-like enolase superfamily enzyme